MARARRSKGSRVSARWVAWTPAMADVFRLATMGSAWTPPRQVRVSPGAVRMSLSAKFTDADGRVMMARLRLRRDQAGDWFVTDEELSIPLGTLRSGATE